MVNSQAGRFEPGWNESILAMARSNVSCTRSSARSPLPLSEIANARRLGTDAKMSSRSESVRGILVPPLILDCLIARALHLGIRPGDIKLSDQLREPVGYPLPHDIVVHGTELVADSGLNLGVQAALLAGCRNFAGLRLYIFHDL